MTEEIFLTVELKELNRQNKEVGNKVANLGELIKKNFNVPNGFVLKINAYDLFLTNNKLHEFIQESLETIDYHDFESIKNCAQIIQNKIDNFEIRILFDKELRDIGTEPKKVFSILKKNLINKFGEKINVSVYEVDKFDSNDPYFISKIDRSKFQEKIYLV